MSKVMVVPVSTWNIYSIFGPVKLLLVRRQEWNGQPAQKTPLAFGGSWRPVFATPDEEELTPQADSCSQLDRGRTPRFTALASTAPSGLCRIDHQSVRRRRRFTQTRASVRPALHRVSLSSVSYVRCFLVIIFRRDRQVSMLEAG